MNLVAGISLLEIFLQLILGLCTFAPIVEYDYIFHYGYSYMAVCMFLTSGTSFNIDVFSFFSFFFSPIYCLFQAVKLYLSYNAHRMITYLAALGWLSLSLVAPLWLRDNGKKTKSERRNRRALHLTVVGVTLLAFDSLKYSAVSMMGYVFLLIVVYVFILNDFNRQQYYTLRCCIVCLGVWLDIVGRYIYWELYLH